MSEPNKRFVTWFELTQRCKLLADAICVDPSPQANVDFHLVAIGSGGWIPARLVGGYLEKKGCVVSYSSITIKSYFEKQQAEIDIQSTPSKIGDDGCIVILVDDLVDTGDTMDAAFRWVHDQFKITAQSAVVFYKPKSLYVPDAYSEIVDNNEWIVFPYETEDSE